MTCQHGPSIASKTFSRLDSERGIFLRQEQLIVFVKRHRRGLEHWRHSMSSGMVISGSMVASFLENRPFTRSLSGKKSASSIEALHAGIASRNNHSLKLEEVRNVESDTELLTSFGEATLPSPGALDNREGVSDFLNDMGPSSPKWGDMIAKSEWPLSGGLGEEVSLTQLVQVSEFAAVVKTIR